MRRLALTVVLFAACANDGTYVLLTVTRAPAVPDGITRLDLSLGLAGRTATASFAKPMLNFPTDLVLDVGTGAGLLSIAAIGRDDSGTDLGEGGATPTVVRGHTTAASLTLLPPSSSPAMLGIDRGSYDFGTVTQGASSGPASFLITNAGPGASGPVSTSVTGDSGAFRVSGCDGQMLASGGSCTLEVSFAPGAVGSFHVTVSVSATPGGSVGTDITGVAVAPTLIAITPSPAAYGAVLEGVTAPQTFMVTNGGSQATGALATAVTGSDAAQFVPSADNCNGQALAPSASCTLQVTFTPSGTTGNRAASLTLTADPGGTAVSTLSGRALTAASVAFADSTHDFGTLDVGLTTTPVDFVVTNSGGQTSGMLTTQVSGSTADFVVDMDACNGQTLAYLAACTIRGHFAPASFGPKSLTVAVGATPGGTASMTWTGVGHDTVTLTVVTPFGGDGSGGDVTTTGINCPTGVCSIVVDRNGASPPPFTLTATPRVDSVFASWSGDCAGTNPMCMLSMTGSKSVTPSFNRKQLALSVTPNYIAGANGLVTSASTPTETSEISCGSTCSVPRFYNDMVTLTASPAPNFYFGGWGGDCASAGDTPTCSLTMTAAYSVTANFTPANRIFTTNATYSQGAVKLQGTGATGTAQMLSGADAICAAAGKALSPSPSPSTWRAVIGTSTIPVQSRFPANVRGWVRPDGNVFADSFSSPFGNAGIVYYPPRLNEAGVSLGATESSWTGCDRNGQLTTADVQTNVAQNCSDWTDSSTSGFTPGLAAGGTVEWLEGNYWVRKSASPFLCNGSYHVVCMQADYHAVVPAPMPSPAGSRRIFVSHDALDSFRGVSNFDGYCASKGNFKALIATNGVTPNSRVSAARGVPVVRMDGVLVSATDTAFLGGGGLAAPINVTQALEYVGFILGSFPPSDVVFTGSSAVNVAGGTGNTCYTTANGSWTFIDPTTSPTFGMPSDPADWWDGQPAVGLGFCVMQGARIYCLEQ